MECKINNWGCAYHASMSNDCQFNVMTNNHKNIRFGIPECGIYRKTKGIPTSWDNFDRLFIKKNFPIMSWTQLLIAVNEIRHVNQQVSLGALRHEARRLGLYKGIQIRWNKKATKYLKDNYKIKGNIEIATYISEHYPSYRTINKQKVIRTFNKKNVEKKMILLGLKRTYEELQFIKNNHIKNGSFKKGAWGGIRKPAKDETIKIWNCNGIKKRMIKINGKFIPYRPWLYKNFIGSIPTGYMVYGKDGDTLNDDPDNLAICKRASLHSAQMLNSYIPLLNAKIKKILHKMDNPEAIAKAEGLNLNYEQMIAYKKQIYVDYNRVSNLIVKFQKRIDKIQQNKNKKYATKTTI